MKQALALLSTYTAGRFDIYALAGDSKSNQRQEIMSALTGQKTPKSKSGVTAIREAFYAIAKPEGNCLWAKEMAFIEWAKGQT